MQVLPLQKKKLEKFNRELQYTVVLIPFVTCCNLKFTDWTSGSAKVYFAPSHFILFVLHTNNETMRPSVYMTRGPYYEAS